MSDTISPCCFFKSYKHGITPSNKQRYKCLDCKKTFQVNYRYNACKADTGSWVTRMLKEGCGIRSIARLLQIVPNTVLRKIRVISKSIKKPFISLGKEYELDELCTYVKRKSSMQWLVYAIRKDTKEVVDYAIGSRTNNTLKLVTDTLILSEAKRVYTDKLKQYASLLPKAMHSTRLHGTNHIERNNLNLRTHLKRLNRRTICFSKSIGMLSACMKIYFWG